MTSPAEMSRYVGDAKFIFRGTVAAIGKANVSHVAESPHTLLVRVDEVLRGSDVVRGLVGRMVTVVHAPEVRHDAGASYLFFTNALVFADNVAVRAVGQVDATDEAVRDVKEHLAHEEARPFEQRVAGADLVVIGRVVGLRAATKQAAPKSEHDPDWWLADVLVLTTLHGNPEQEIAVAYANSRDIAWRQAPKLRSGETYLLVLRELTDVKLTNHRVYQAIDPLDSLPVERAADVQRVLDKKGRG